MAVIRDVMPAFELYQPASADDAVALLTQYGADAWVMAGGLDSFDWLKDRIKRPKVVVLLSDIQGLRGMRAAGITAAVFPAIVRAETSVMPIRRQPSTANTLFWVRTAASP